MNKVTDWYSRAVLTVIAGILLCVTAELRIANQLQSALNSTTRVTDTYRLNAPQLSSVALMRPVNHLESYSDVTNVRIVSYVYNGKEVFLGDGGFSAPSKSRGLPVSTVK